MPESRQTLGRPIAVHGIAPAYLQRAMFIVILSFLFFLAMMFVYYINQSIGYFLLASAFLVIYLFTLFSFVRQRRNVVSVYENGISYKDVSVKWSEIEGVDANGMLNLRSGKTMALPNSLHENENLLNFIRQSAVKSD
jgi:hypothetical protein